MSLRFLKRTLKPLHDQDERQPIAIKSLRTSICPPTAQVRSYYVVHLNHNFNLCVLDIDMETLERLVQTVQFHIIPDGVKYEPSDLLPDAKKTLYQCFKLSRECITRLNWNGKENLKLIAKVCIIVDCIANHADLLDLKLDHQKCIRSATPIALYLIDDVNYDSHCITGAFLLQNMLKIVPLGELEINGLDRVLFDASMKALRRIHIDDKRVIGVNCENCLQLTRKPQEIFDFLAEDLVMCTDHRRTRQDILLKLLDNFAGLIPANLLKITDCITQSFAHGSEESYYTQVLELILNSELPREIVRNSIGFKLTQSAITYDNSKLMQFLKTEKLTDVTNSF